MSLVYSLFLFSSPFFAWGDSLYLDSPRLGSVSWDDGEVTWSQCIYTDITVALLREAEQYSIGLRPVPIGEQKPIQLFLESAVVESKADSTTVSLTQGYWFRGKLYNASACNGPWEDIDMMLARLSPTNYIKVSPSSMGGTEAIAGTLYTSDRSTFRSSAGTYELAAPSLTTDAYELIVNRADSDTSQIETRGVAGILYLQAGFPLFFYIID